MAIAKRNKVSITVDSNFFDDFEKDRKRMQMKIKLDSGLDKNLSQFEFTKILARNKMKMNKDLFKINFNNGFTKRKKR